MTGQASVVERCSEQFAQHPTQPHLVAVCTLPPHGPEVEHSNVLPKPGVPR